MVVLLAGYGLLGFDWSSEIYFLSRFWCAVVLCHKRSAFASFSFLLVHVVLISNEKLFFLSFSIFVFLESRWVFSMVGKKFSDRLKGKLQCINHVVIILFFLALMHQACKGSFTTHNKIRQDLIIRSNSIRFIKIFILYIIFYDII